MTKRPSLALSQYKSHFQLPEQGPFHSLSLSLCVLRIFLSVSYSSNFTPEPKGNIPYSANRQTTKMSTENGPVRLSTMATRPTEPEHLPCPRCDSTNTKFCYYNNYNLSQPRHFCKSCRRYWTRGGTLRNVPVGGGSRKSASSSNKRPRTTNATTPTTTATSACLVNPIVTATSASSSSDMTHDPLHAAPVSMVSHMGSGSSHMAGSLAGCEVNLNEAVPEAASFSSLLTTQVGAGYLPFGNGFGLGTGPGLHGVGFGLGMMDWPIDSVSQGNGNVGVGVEGGGSGGGGDGGGGGGGGNGSGGSSGCNTWQIGGVEGGLGDGDCFGWPDLAISMPGKGLK